MRSNRFQAPYVANHRPVRQLEAVRQVVFFLGCEKGAAQALLDDSY